jgi:hypothetical protein
VADKTLLMADDQPDKLALIPRVEDAELPVWLSLAHDGLEAVARELTHPAVDEGRAP